MSDSRVLAGLQLAHSLTDNADTQRSIESAWQNETNSWNIVYPNVTERIRAWTPPADAPDLAARMAELEELIGQERIERMAAGRRYVEMITALVKRIDDLHPEPPAPDGPDEVCTCGHPRKSHGNNSGFIVCRHNLFCKCVEFTPKPAPAADLDPVMKEGREQAIKQQAIVTVLQRYHSIASSFDKSSLNRMAMEMLREMSVNGETR